MKRKHTASLFLLACVLVVVISGCGGIGQRSYDSYKSLEAALDGNFLLPDYFAYGLSPDNPDVSFSGGSHVKVKTEKAVEFSFDVKDEKNYLSITVFNKEPSTDHRFRSKKGEIIKKVKGRNISFYYIYSTEWAPNEEYALYAFFKHWLQPYCVVLSREPVTQEGPEEFEEFKEQDMEEIIKVIESMLP